MVIFTDIKPLIVAGFVLVLVNSSNGHPLPHQRKTQDSGSFGRMTMLKKSCVDSIGNVGVCMFKWDCISQQGVTLSTCVDGFLFGACCALNEGVEEKWTLESYHKSTTNSNFQKSNTIAVINHVTLSNLQEKTMPFIQVEDVFDSNSRSSTNSKSFNDDMTTEFLDIFTTSKFSSSESVSTNTMSTVENAFDTVFDSSIKSSNITNIENELIDRGILIPNDGKNHTTLELKSEVSSENLDLDLRSDNSGNNGKYSHSVNKFQNVSDVEKDSSSVNELLEDGRTEIITEPYELQETERINYTEDAFLGRITHPTFTIENAITSDFLTLENTPESLTQTRHEILIDSEENFIEEQIYEKTRISINTTKDRENSTLIEITTLFTENQTSAYPPGFHDLISQLTLEETSDIESSVLPTLKTDFSSQKLNISESEKSELLVNVIKDFTSLSPTSDSDMEIEQTVTENVYYSDENNNYLLVSNEKLDSHQKTEIVPSTYQTNVEILNSTITVTPFLINSTTAINTDSNSNTGFNHSAPDHNEETFSTSIHYSNEATSNTILLNTNVNNTTKLPLYNFNNSAQEQSQIPCDKENNVLNENCTKSTNSGNIEYNKLYTSLDSITEKYMETTDKNSVLFANESNDDLTLPEETFKQDYETTSTTSFSSMVTSIEDKNTTIPEITSVITTEGNIVNDNFDYSETGEESDIILDLSDPIPAAFGNEDFLFDITTDILTYFSKPENNNLNMSELHEPNLIFTTNELDENYTIESANTSNTPSHTIIQQTSDSTAESTTTKIVSSLSSTTYFIGHTDNYNEKLPIHSLETDYTTENGLNEESTSSDYAFTNNMNFTTQITTLPENDINETSSFSESVFNSTSEVNSSATENSQSNFTTFAYETDFQSTSFADPGQGITKYQDESSVTLNPLHEISSIYSDTSSNSSVNISIPIRTENSSSASTINSHLNHTILTFTNSDIFNNTESNSSVYNIHNMTSALDYTSLYNSTLSSVTVKAPPDVSEAPGFNKVWNYKKDCGVRPMQKVGRIVGGSNTQFGKWPWQALVKEATWLGLFVKNKCGGVLITSKYVLTAAHCQPGFLASLLVVLGTHDISNLKDSGLQVIRSVKRMVVHRHYNAQTFENDLALLEMETELEFMPHVVPICLPYRYEDFTGEMAFVTGWGKLTHGGDVPNILQEVQVPIVANSECQMMFYQAGHQKAIQNNFVCAGYTNGEKDSCEGDSGGPLMVQRKDKRWVLVGTVSHGIGCADPNLPGVYMRMSSYRPWIDSIINK